MIISSENNHQNYELYQFLQVSKVYLRRIGFGALKTKEREFQVMGVIRNYDFENHPLHADSREILAF